MRPQQSIQQTIGQVRWRDTETSESDQPMIHAGRTQKQCGIFSNLLPKRRVDHHKVAIDQPALLAPIVAETPTMLITEPDTDLAGCVVAFDGVPVVDHLLPPSDLFDAVSVVDGG
ncbi:MAG: hypothetical protein P8Z76_20145 [Alphaproteobacteria bacterium]